MSGVVQRIVRFVLVVGALTIVAVLVIVASVVGLGWLFARFVSHFSSVFLPLAVGWVGALVCRPYNDWLRSRLKLPAALAMVVVLLSIIAPLIEPRCASVEMESG